MFADGSILGSIMFLESFFSPWLRVTLGGENKFVQWGLGGGEIKAWKFVFIFQVCHLYLTLLSSI